MPLPQGLKLLENLQVRRLDAQIGGRLGAVRPGDGQLDHAAGLDALRLNAAGEGGGFGVGLLQLLFGGEELEKKGGIRHDRTSDFSIQNDTYGTIPPPGCQPEGEK